MAVTSIPKAYFDPLILDVLRQHFSTYGELNQWVPLPGFGRILGNFCFFFDQCDVHLHPLVVVYNEDEDAETAKQHCDPIILKASHDRWALSRCCCRFSCSFVLRSQVILRVYRADPNPLIPPRDGSLTHGFIPEANFLRPPEIEKNFLISPPGSPPVGWEPIKEDPPNAAPLADDLMAALRKLQINNRGSGMETLLDPKEGSGVGVYVQDCDGDDEDREIADEDWIYGESAPARAKWMPVATAMPPLRSAIIA